MISRGRTLGVLTLGSRVENSIHPEDADFLMRAAGQLAINPPKWDIPMFRNQMFLGRQTTSRFGVHRNQGILEDDPRA